MRKSKNKFARKCGHNLNISAATVKDMNSNGYVGVFADDKTRTITITRDGNRALSEHNYMYSVCIYELMQLIDIPNYRMQVESDREKIVVYLDREFIA